MPSYNEFIARQKRQFGEKFDPSCLDQRFVRFYESGNRIKVDTGGMVVTGTIGVTTGWRPVFLLMRTARSLGSVWTLCEKDVIIGVKRGKKYSEISCG